MASWELSEAPAKLAAFGTSAKSSVATMLGAATTGNPPGAAVVTVGTVSTNSIAITWTLPTAPADAPVQGFTVWRQQGSNTPVQMNNGLPLPATPRSYTFTGLAQGTSYTVWVV